MENVRPPNLYLRNQEWFRSWAANVVRYAIYKKKVRIQQQNRGQPLSETSKSIFNAIQASLINLMGSYEVTRVVPSLDGQNFTKEVSYIQHFFNSLQQLDLRIREIPEMRENEDQFKWFIKEEVKNKINEEIERTSKITKGIEIAGSVFSEVNCLQ